MHSAVYYICIYIYIYISIRTTSRLLRMRQMFHVKHGVDAPPTTCMRSPKRKSSEIDASPQLPISTGVQCLDRSRLPWSVRSIDRDYQGQLSWRLKSRVLMYSYATRGLGFLVRCATISRQLGQGRQRSGGSPLFMINHRSSIYTAECIELSTVGLAPARPNYIYPYDL